MTNFKFCNTRKRIAIAVSTGLAVVFCVSAAWYTSTSRRVTFHPEVAGVSFGTSLSEQKMPPDAARSLLERHLNRFIEESDSMLESRINALTHFFEERKEGAPLFAAAVLDLGAKCRAAAAAGEALLAKTVEFFGGAPQTNGPDSFSLYVGQCFREKVLDAADARRAMEQAIAGFRGDIAEAEGRLLVTLKVDVPDLAIDGEHSLPILETEAPALTVCDAVIAEAVDAATTDLGAALGMFLASTVASNELVKQTVPEDASLGTQIVSNLAAGVAADMATEQAARAMGYNPEGNLAAKTKAGLDRIRDAITDGDPAMTSVYPTLSIFRRTHPDAGVRDACRRADEAVVRVANLGMRERLRRLRNDRYRGLWSALMAKLSSGEASQSPFLMYQPLDTAQCSPADEIIHWAEQVAVAYGAQK